MTQGDTYINPWAVANALIVWLETGRRRTGRSEVRRSVDRHMGDSRKPEDCVLHVHTDQRASTMEKVLDNRGDKRLDISQSLSLVPQCRNDGRMNRADTVAEIEAMCALRTWAPLYSANLAADAFKYPTCWQQKSTLKPPNSIISRGNEPVT